MTQTAPFWSHPSEHYGGHLSDKADIVIVGGGITGVSLLYHLKKRRMRALLLERGHLASGASGRNAGFVLAGVADNYATAVRTYGRERAREIWAFTVENHDAVASALKNADVGHNRCGTVILAASDEERVQLEESAELLTDDGFQAHFDGDVLYNPRDGEINPTALVAGLARLAPDGSIHEHVNVTGLVADSNRVFVHLEDETVEAGTVILATNAWTSLLAPSVKITPRRAQMLATSPVERVIADKPTYSDFGYRYWRQLTSGVLLIGGWRNTSMETEETFDDKPTVRDPGANRGVRARRARGGHAGDASVGGDDGVHGGRAADRRAGRGDAARVRVRRLQRSRHGLRIPERQESGRLALALSSEGEGNC